MVVINFFEKGEKYCFKHYFDDRDLFEELEEYYDGFEYVFKVGEEDLEEVIDILESFGFEVNIVGEDEIVDFTVIINKYEKHSNLLKKAVDVVEFGDEKALVLKDKAAREEGLLMGREPGEEWIKRL